MFQLFPCRIQDLIAYHCSCKHSLSFIAEYTWEVDVWWGVWRCTHAKLTPLTPHPLARDRHNGPASRQKGKRFGQATFLLPFLLGYSSVWTVRLHSPFVLGSIRISGLDGKLAARYLRSGPAWIVFCFHCWVADGKNGEGGWRGPASGSGWRRLWAAHTWEAAWTHFILTAVTQGHAKVISHNLYGRRTIHYCFNSFCLHTISVLPLLAGWNVSVFIGLFSYLHASGHTVHCLGHDSISSPAIGPFFSIFIWKIFFFHFGKSRAMKGVIFFSFSKF